MRESVKFSGSSHIGLVRTNNEDSYAIVSRGETLPFGLVLADGMGGHRRGELASLLAVDYVSSRLLELIPDLPAGQQLERLLSDLVQKANVKVYLGSLENNENRGMGTTLTMLVVRERQASVAHIGDSRAYLYRGTSLYQLTTDHTLVQELIKAGSLTRAESQRHPQRNILTRSLGVPDFIEPEINTVMIERHDRLLLCSDGLHGCVPDDQICAAVRDAREPEELVNRLIQLALDRGGEDNITVLAAFFN